jgi:hypothetical protein
MTNETMATPSGGFEEIRELFRNTKILLDQAGQGRTNSKGWVVTPVKTVAI